MSAPFEIRLEADAGLDDDCCLASIACTGAAPDGAVQTGLTPLGEARFENWYVEQPVRRMRHQQFHCACNDELLFGSIAISSGEAVEAETFSSYRELLSLLQQHGGFSLLRIWHYLPQLCGPQRKTTPYQLFCRARARALAKLPRSRYCAATVIGTQAPRGVIYFLAAKQPGTGIVNPRQANAYRYPAHYADPPPTFARATLKLWAHAAHLYISGTASIVGYRSTHPGDVAAQFDEIGGNLQALLEQAEWQDRIFSRASVNEIRNCKIYLARASDRDTVLNRARSFFGEHADFRLLQGEICRPELLIEVEGMVSRQA